MSKTTINVSQQLLTSILIGFLLGLFVVVAGHLSPKNWMYRPQTSSNFYTGNSKVSSCGYECMFGEWHSGDCSGITASEVGNKGLTVGEIFSASFEHMSLFLILWLIASALIYTIKRVSFKVVKE